MRPDMFKVIVERPRVGGGCDRLHRALVADLDAPLHQGMTRPYKNRKGLNENLSPLRRFLESRIGKHWPKIYAEICENLRPSSTVQQHVRDHLADFVATWTFIKDGEIWVHDRRPCRLDETRSRFFVHPVSGCLMRNKKWQSYFSKRREQQAQEAAKIPERRRDIRENLQLHKLKGCWYEVTLAPIASRRQTRTGPLNALRDEVIGAGLSGLNRLELYGRFDVLATSKRQLSRRELRKYRLEND